MILRLCANDALNKMSPQSQTKTYFHFHKYAIILLLQDCFALYSCYSIFSYGIPTYISGINKYMREKSKTNKYSAIEIVCGRKLGSVCDAMFCRTVVIVVVISFHLLKRHCAPLLLYVYRLGRSLQKKCSRFIIKIHVYIYI